MTDQFGSSDDNQDKNKDGFGQGSDDKSGQGESSTVTAEDLAALSKRFDDTQAFVEQLKAENAELRTDKSELANALASATTLDDVLNKIGGTGGEGQPNLDPNKVVEQVEQRLQQRASETVKEQNWNDVYERVTQVYGSWDKANEEIERKAIELAMDTTEASNLAKRSPAAFFELFLPKQGGQQRQSSASSASGQQTSDHASDSQARDKAYYTELRRKNGRKYWTEEVQAQYRRDRETWS